MKHALIQKKLARVDRALDQAIAKSQIPGAVVLARSSRGTIVLTGADRGAFLHALLTNDIAALAKGNGTYAAYLTPQGRMIADMRVLETGDRVLLVGELALDGAVRGVAGVLPTLLLARRSGLQAAIIPAANHGEASTTGVMGQAMLARTTYYDRGFVYYDERDPSRSPLSSRRACSVAMRPSLL